MEANLKYISELVNHLLAQDSPEKMEKAIRDMFTDSELAEMTNRLKIIEMLERGVPQRRIADDLGVGIATVTRGSKVLKARRRKKGHQP